MEGRLLPTNVVADRLGVSIRTVQRMCESGELPAQKVGSKLWGVAPTELDKYIAGVRERGGPVLVWRHKRHVSRKHDSENGSDLAETGSEE